MNTTSKRTVTAVLAASVLALLGIIPASADTRTDIRDLAAANLNKNTCSTNSLGGTGYMDSCRLEHAWCSDFARWVWGNRNINADRLSAAAGSFYRYGELYGTLHTDPSYVPQLGDAVVLNYHGGGRADHVSLVDSVYSNGTIRTINGNFGGSGPLSSTVQYATGGGRVGQVIAGQTISAFVSPAGAGTTRPTFSRIGVRFADTSVHVKEGNLYDNWVLEHGGGIVKSEVDGDMIGVLTSSGDLHVKQGNLHQSWFHQASGVKDFSLESSKGRVGIVRTDGTVAVKEGGVQGLWVEEMNGATEVELSGDYLGVVSTDGTAFVKKGNLYESWTSQLGGVADLEISAAGDRIGALRTNGTLTVKEGGLYGSWVEQTSNVKDFDLSGDYIGVVFNDGLATVKQGNLFAGWINQMSDAQAIEVDAKTGRIGALRANGSLTVKEGGPYGAWVEQTSGVTEFQLTNY
ncbi:CHAP domain-containing protein [Lentzea sp. PSKA42]|uniref:CHAP domain-containing protein n=1 Tax=Lentzea indica TaxID=2604800 RepID=A0ABX1FPU2_9PSEU|nr:CHAP domain-containing protein [Lentzea indica]NKE61029.1 CHAP domain-containing protein [Lentzea indica]